MMQSVNHHMFKTQADLPGPWTVLRIVSVAIVGAFGARTSIRSTSYLTASPCLLRPVREYLRTYLILFEKKEKGEEQVQSLLLKQVVLLFSLTDYLFPPSLCQYSNFCGSAVNQIRELVLKWLLLKHIFPEVLVQFPAQLSLGQEWEGGRAGGSTCQGTEEGQDPSSFSQLAQHSPWLALPTRLGCRKTLGICLGLFKRLD